MQSKIAILFCLFLAINASSPSKKLMVGRNLEGSSVSDLGQIPITGPNYFYIPADLDYDPVSGTSGSTINMMLALYTSKSLLSTNCLGFETYDYIAHNDSISTTYYSLLLMNFKANGYFFNPNLWLDYNHWNLNTNAIFSDSACKSLNVSYAGSGLSGVIGLGYGNNASINFLDDSALISVYVTDDLQSGELMFKEDDTKKASPDAVATVVSDNNWRVPSVTGIVVGDNTIATNSGCEIAFDLNTFGIGLPSEIYTSFIEDLMTAVPTLSCSDSIYFPECTYTGALADLPTFYFTVADTSIPIPYDLYVQNTEQLPAEVNGTITLIVKSVATSLGGENHITSLYTSNIIMGVQALSYYYTVFSGNFDESTSTITLYKAVQNLIGESGSSASESGSSITGNNGTTTTMPEHWWIWVLIAAAFLIGIILYCNAMRKRKGTATPKADEQQGLMMA